MRDFGVFKGLKRFVRKQKTFFFFFFRRYFTQQFDRNPNLVPLQLERGLRSKRNVQ